VRGVPIPHEGETEARQDCADIPGGLERFARPTRPITNPTLASESESLARRRDAGPEADFLRHRITNTPTRTMLTTIKAAPTSTNVVCVGVKVEIGLEKGDPMLVG
jgi:hypothetical protein